jgi:hypothetical protein
LKFNASTLDQQLILARATGEADKIVKNDKTGRSYREILETCLYGQAAEAYLLSIGYVDDTRPYKDVFEPDGTSIEVKVTAHSGNVPYILDRCAERIGEVWRTHPTRVYIFINDKKSDEYTLYGIYDWNGKTWIKK